MTRCMGLPLIDLYASKTRLTHIEIDQPADRAGAGNCRQGCLEDHII